MYGLMHKSTPQVKTYLWTDLMKFPVTWWKYEPFMKMIAIIANDCRNYRRTMTWKLKF
jgi:hypothetical protein